MTPVFVVILIPASFVANSFQVKRKTRIALVPFHGLNIFFKYNGGFCVHA